MILGTIKNDLQDDEDEGSLSQDRVNCQWSLSSPDFGQKPKSENFALRRQENRRFSGSPPGSQTPNIFPSSIKLQHKAGR